MDYTYYSYIKQILLRQDSLLNLVSERTSLKVEKEKRIVWKYGPATANPKHSANQNVERELHKLNLQIMRILQLDMEH